MARVPANIPAEPGESRCGDSYKDILWVNGLIPGTDFGKQFEKRIDPVKLQGTGLYPSPTIPLFESEAAMREETEAESGIRAQLLWIYTKLELDSWAYSQDDQKTLKELARRGLDLLKEANIDMREYDQGIDDGAADDARQKVESAARHLRCAEYWIWRIILYKKALDQYEPPQYPTLIATPPPEPGLGVFPPLEPDDEEPPDGVDRPTKKKPEKAKVSPWLIVGGIALAGVTYYLFLRKK